MSDRPASYQYFELFSDHLGGDLSKVFSGEPVYPRQLEIHLPGACNFDCYYCHGRTLEQPQTLCEECALRMLDRLGGKCPYVVYSGYRSEPLLNPYLLDFLRLTKQHGSYFGLYTNGALLKQLEEKQSFLSQYMQLATPSGLDWLSISLDAGTPRSHKITKTTDVEWFDEIIEGIRMAVEIRGKDVSNPAIRVCYLMNKSNSSEKEIKGIIEVMEEIGVDSLKFSIPYAAYGKSLSMARHHKRSVEVGEDAIYTALLEPLVSKDKPHIFYLPPSCQDVDRMNFKQCIFSYFQITLGADGYVYKCESTANPFFSMNRLGKVTDDLDAMILANHDPDFKPSTCFEAGGRCTRMALEINDMWAKLKEG